MRKALATKVIDGGLPVGWRWVRLDTVCEVRLGKMLSPASKVGYRAVSYLRNANVQWNRFDLTEIAEMDFTEEQEAALALRAGDLLVCEGGEPGRAAVWEGQVSRCCYQKALHRLRPINSAVDPYFVMYRLWQGALNGEFTESNGQTTIAHLPGIRLKTLKLAIPQVGEQQRIAGVLREQMTAVEKASTAAQARLEAAGRLRDAFMEQCFEEGGAAAWPRISMGEVCEIAAPQVDPNQAEFRDLPHVNGENLKPGTGELFNIKSAADDRMTSGKYLFEPGVVLYSKLRPYLRKATVGDFRGLCSADMYPIAFDTSRVDPHFALWVLLSRSFTDYAVSESQRARMPKLNRDQLFAWKFPTPSLAVQRRVVAVIQQRMHGVQRLASSLEEELQAINALPAAVLRLAFSGGS